MIRQPLHRTRFRTWLRRQQPDAIVGRPYNSQACPLFTHLQAQGLECQGVTTPRYYTNSDVWTTPRWAAHFIHCIDLLPPEQPVTAAQALTVLDEVPS